MRVISFIIGALLSADAFVLNAAPHAPACRFSNLEMSSAATLSPFASQALDIVKAHPIVKHNPYCEWFGTGSVSVSLRPKSGKKSNLLRRTWSESSH